MKNPSAISPADILGAVLYAAPKKRKVSFVSDEGKTVPSEDPLPVVSIEQRDSGVICTIPLSEIVEYLKEPHLMQFQVIGGPCEDTAVITFEKQSLLGEVLAVSGKRALPSNNLMSRFLAELNGLKVDEQNTIKGS